MKSLRDIVTVTIIRASYTDTLIEWCKHGGPSTVTNIAAFYAPETKTVVIGSTGRTPSEIAASELHELGHAFYHQETGASPTNAQNEAFACACEFLPAALVGDAQDLIDLGMEKLDSVKHGYPYTIDMDTIDHSALVALMEQLLERIFE